MKIYIFIITIFLLFPGIDAHAQKAVIRGKVTDKGTGEVLPFVTIAEMDKESRIVSGTVTDINGNYTIEIKNTNEQIVVSFIGYKTLKVDINNRSIIDFALETEAIDIEELVIVGTRTTSDPLSNIAERDRTSSTAKIDMSELLATGVVSADDAMQGQLSGVDIVSSGSPGSGANIVIRGMGTLGNSTPLIVVDGIPQDVKGASDFDFSTADQEGIGSLVSISPQDIKSIEVLKDAGSVAVWGSKGANGVLLIETLRGVRGRTRFSYQNKTSFSKAPPDLPLLNGDEYIMLQLEELHAPTGLFNVPAELSGDPTILGINYYNYIQNTDWLSYLTQVGVIQDHYFKISGGGQRTNYFSSINLVDETGTTINTGLKRITSRTNVDYRVSNKLSFSSNFSYSGNTKIDNYPYRINETVRDMAIRKAPNMSIWELDEKGNNTGEYFTPIRSYQGTGSLYYNPVAMSELGKNNTEENTVETSFFLKYNILPWLNFQEVISFTYLNSKMKKFLPYNAIGEDWLYNMKNFGNEINRSTSRLLTRSQLFINPRLKGNHSVSSSLMWETKEENSYYISLANSQSPSTLIADPAAGSVLTWVNSGQTVVKSIGALAQLFYKYRDKYMLTANLRFDGNSKFGLNSRYGLFPSISAGWRFSSEPWVQNLTFLGESKIRFSYGISGNDRSDPNGLQAYDRHSAYGLTGSTQNAYIDNALILPLRIQLDQLRWEKITQWNTGIDLILFKRATIIFDVYNKVTSDILWKNYNIPSSSGYPTLLWINGGKLNNQGWELSLDYQLIKRTNLSFRLKTNISRNVNKYLAFPDNFNNEVSTNLGNSQYPRRAVLNQPVGSFYGLRFLGVWPDDNSVHVYNENDEIIKDPLGNNLPLTYQSGYIFQGGDARYEDLNHDGVIDLNDVVYLGNANPSFEGGFGAIAKIKKNLNVSFMFHARLDYSIVNLIASQTQGMNNYNNQSKAVLKRWRKPGDNYEGILPRAYFANPVNNLGSDRYVEDGSFLRLNNISVSYDFPKQLCEKLHTDQINAGFTVRKLYTWTNYTGQDPEITPSNDPFFLGADTGKTPVPMRMTLSLTVNF